MSIYRVSGTQKAQTEIAVQGFRTGQIIQGKILKLYPENKAQIQLGSQKMIAQLEASLSVGGKYHFQVQATGDVIHLRVLGEPLVNQEHSNATNLMQQLGLKTSKTNTDFLQTLIGEKIPFDKVQLSRAFQVLDGVKNKVQAGTILKEMITAKFPITESVYHALVVKHSSSSTVQMKSVLQQLRQDSIKPQLTDRLSRMVEPPSNASTALIKQILNEIMTNNRQLFTILKAAGAVDQSVEFSAWKSQWEAVAKQNNLNLQHITNQQTSTLKLPHQINANGVIQAFEQMVTNKEALLSGTREITQLWGDKISRSVAVNSTLSLQEFSQMKQQVTQLIAPLLSDGQLQITKIVQNNPVQLRQLLAVIQTLNHMQTYTTIEHTLHTVNTNKGFIQATPRDQFMMQVNQTLLFTGLSYENQLAKDPEQQQATVKGMLLQLLQHSDGAVNERGQQLLHFINGMQLSTVNETTNFLQASLQVPGERLGLASDLNLEIEGRKTAEGEINPDYCRILFYLDLANLKETIIDMNIQKRAVAVTIFNDTDQLKDLSISIQPVLKEGLQDLNYQLSTVAFKPIKKSDDPIKAKTAYQPSYKGVDFRI
ncbi:hypothetical protein QGM71_04270 [Virgibacillus sp. C22-A2]|uniref:Flagellar hook-length control protein FliK n=1 Tax=Virgibacillus tibetensis TaxID=3042313 RepID=A0ABU6KC42_9BACI|nr:hypothetical protein [Virgibacillus sp. C22-A2]